MLLYLALDLFGFYLYYQLIAKRRNLPPGPMPLPFIGSHQVLKHEFPHLAMVGLTKIFGPIFTIWLGNEAAVIITDYHIMKKYIAGKTADIFAGRPRNEVFEFLNRGRHGVITLDGPPWKEQRRFALQVLRNFGFGRNTMEAKIMEEVDTLTDIIEYRISEGGKSTITSLEMPIQVCVGSIISNVILGHRFAMDDERFIEMKKVLDENFQLIIRPEMLLIAQYFWLRHLPYFSSSWAVLKKHNQIFLRFLFDELDNHKKELNFDEEPTDFSAAYLKEIKDREVKGENPGYFSEWQLCAMIADVWTAGMETTVTTLKWALLYMVNDPDIQDRVRSEIQTLLDGSDRPLTMNDKTRLPYTMATITEVQRCANIVPINLMHMTMEDVDVEGFLIPKGTTVIPLISAVHVDEKLFPDPYKFDPERFLERDENGLKVVRSDDVLAFSLGKRACLGESLARMELFLIFATLIQKFKFSTPPGVDKLPTKPVPGFTLCPQRYELKIERV